MRILGSGNQLLGLVAAFAAAVTLISPIMAKGISLEDVSPAWSKMTAQKCETDFKAKLAHAQGVIRQIESRPVAEMSYLNTFQALDDAVNGMYSAYIIGAQLANTCDSVPLRAMMSAVAPLLAEYESGFLVNERVYEKVKAFAQDNTKMSLLSDTQKRYVKLLIEEFETGGVGLPADKKARFMAANMRLSELAEKFSKMVLDSTQAFKHHVTDEAQLDGLPEQAVKEAESDARAAGLADGWLFTLTSNSSTDAIRYGKSAELRKAIYVGVNTVGAGKWNTAPVLWEMVQLRDEVAKLLGYENYMDHTTHLRMAKTGQAVEELEEGIYKKVKSSFDAECNTLIEFAKQRGYVPADARGLYPWDAKFVTNQYREEELQFDPKVLLDYFPQDQVLRGLFELCESFLGIIITERPTYCANAQGDLPTHKTVAVEVWHPDVQFFEVKDKQSGKVIGGFYTDWYTREGKRSGGWMCPLLTPSGAPRLALIACNLNRPTDPTKPAMFSLLDVETIFHELGHVLHHVLSEVPVNYLSGTNVVQDFVELPSQLMENFCHDARVLKTITRHIKTNHPMEDAVIDKLVAMKKFMPATKSMFYIEWGRVDRAMHLHLSERRDKDLGVGDNLERDEKEYLKGYNISVLDDCVPRSAIARNSTHLFSNGGGYAGGLYVYLWALILDADVYKKIADTMPSNPLVGLKYRQEILSKGNSKPADELFRNFMGREPRPDAYYQREGISPE